MSKPKTGIFLFIRSLHRLKPINPDDPVTKIVIFSSIKLSYLPLPTTHTLNPASIANFLLITPLQSNNHEGFLMEL